MYSLNIKNNAQVMAITGQVNQVIDNQLIELRVGNNIKENETLIIDDNSTITLEYADGSLITYTQKDATLVSDNTATDNQDTLEPSDTSIADEISAIQDAISEGDDDLELPATAAGGNGSQGGISFISLERDASDSDINSNFTSESLIQTSSELQFALTPQEAVLVPSISLSYTLNHQEKSLTISGNTSNNGPNPLVTLTITDINNVTIIIDNITVDPLGNYIIDNIDLSTLSDGGLNIQVVVVDDINQPISVSEVVEFDSTAPIAPSFTINDGGDGIINSDEKAQGIDLTIDLSQPGISVGNIVTVIFGTGDNTTSINVEITQEILDRQPPAIIVPVPEQHLTDTVPLEALITITDNVGNTSPPAVLSRIVDTIAPDNNQENNRPIIDVAEAQDGINKSELSDGIQTLVTPPNGSQVGDVIIITITPSNGAPTQEVRVTIEEPWNSGDSVPITIAPSLISQDGQYELTSQVVDPAGNLSQSSEVITLNIDTTAPGENTGRTSPINDIPEAQDNINKEELSDGIDINIKMPFGSAIGDIITVTIQPVDGSEPLIFKSNIPDTWVEGEDIIVNIPNSEFFTDGDYNVISNVTDQSGNKSLDSDITPITIDTQAPANDTPPALAIKEANDGIINHDEASDGVLASVTIAEGAKVGDIIVLKIVHSDGAITNIHHTLTENNIATIIDIVIPVTTLNDGNYNITAAMSDSSGNIGESSNNIGFILDTSLPGEITKPAPPIVTVIDAENDHAINDKEFTNAGGIAVNVTIPSDIVAGEIISVTLTFADASTPLVIEHIVTLAEVQANITQVTFIDENLIDGDYSVSAIATHNNIDSHISNIESFTLDRTAPGKGEGSDGPNGDSEAPLVTVVDQLTVNNNDISVIALDEANDGIQVSVTPPTGSLPGDKIILSVTLPNGLTEEVVNVIPNDWVDGQDLEITIPVSVISHNGSFVDGNYEITAIVIDAYGNESIESQTNSITLATDVDGDNGAISPPVIHIDAAVDGYINNNENDGFIVAIDAPSNASIGDVITIKLDAQSDDINDASFDITIPVDWDGTSPITDTLSSLIDGEQYEVTATIISGGQTSNTSNQIDFIIDTTAPGENGNSNNAPTITINEASDNVNADEAADGVTVQVTPPPGSITGDIITILVTQPGGNVVKIEQPIPVNWNEGDGAIDVTIPVSDISVGGEFNDGDYIVIATITDQAGNSSISSSDNFTLITSTVETPVISIKGIDEASNDLVIDDTEIKNSSNQDVIEVTLTAPVGTKLGDTIRLIVSKEINEDGYIDFIIDNNFNISQPIVLEINAPIDGEYNISAQIINSAGQASSGSNEIAFAIETQPQTITLSGPENVVEGDITSEFTVTLSENVPIGETITVSFVYSGTAKDDTDDTDYTKIASVDIVGGQNVATFNLNTIDDAIYENPNETITITINEIKGTNTTGGFSQLPIAANEDTVTTTILADTDSLDAPVMSISGPDSIYEGSTGKFTISIDTPAQAPYSPGHGNLSFGVYVNVNEVNQGANINDHSAMKTTLIIFEVGEFEKTIDINAILDDMTEGLEQFTISLDTIVINDNSAGYERTPVISSTNNSVTFNIIDQAPLQILTATDNSDDYSSTSLSGIGGQVGQTVQIIDSNNNEIGQTVITADGQWTINLTSNTLPQVNIQYPLTARLFSSSNTQGTPIELSNSINYLETDSTRIETTSENDFIFTGLDDDEIVISMDNNDKKITVDGGADNDNAIINELSTDFISGVDDDNNLTLIHSSGKVITLIDIEKITFNDKEFIKDELLTSRININDSDGYLSSAELQAGVDLSGQIFDGATLTGITITGVNTNGEPKTYNFELDDISINSNGTFNITSPNLLEVGFSDGDFKVALITIIDSTQSIVSDRSIVDIQPPNAIAVITGISDDTGLSNADFITTDNQITLSGTLTHELETGETLQLLINNEWITISNINSDLTWSYDDSRLLPDGEYLYVVKVTDERGNSSINNEKTIFIDKNSTDNSGAIVGIDYVGGISLSESDTHLTNKNNITVEGSFSHKLQDDEFIQVNFDGTWVNATKLFQIINGENLFGWYYTHTTPLNDDIYNYQARVISAAGHIISEVTQSIEIDTTISDTQIFIDSISEDTGRSDSDFITNDNNMIEFNGNLSQSLEIDESLQIFIDGNWITIDPINIITNNTGTTWSYQDTRTDLEDGRNYFKLRIQDTTGNNSPELDYSIYIDTNSNSNSYTASTGAEIINLAITDDFGTSTNFNTTDTTIMLSGQLTTLILHTSEKLEVKINDDWVNIYFAEVTTEVDSETIFVSANWQLDLSDVELEVGSHTFEFRIIDAAGNITDTTSQTVVIEQEILMASKSNIENENNDVFETNEYLIGENGNDVLINVLDSLDASKLPHEVIEGFTLHKDKLDLSNLINLDSNNDLEKYLSISSDDHDTIISVTSITDNEPEYIVTLEGVDLSEQLKLGQSSVINTLFNNLGDEALMSHKSTEAEPNYNIQQLLDDSNISE